VLTTFVVPPFPPQRKTESSDAATNAD